VRKLLAPGQVDLALSWKRGTALKPVGTIGSACHRSLILCIGAIALSAFLAASWFLLKEHEIAGVSGYPVDDSWIYATFARNLANGHGYSFNPGHPISGATGPLYVFVLSALYRMFGGVVWPAKVLGILCLLGSGWIVFASTRRASPESRWLPLLAGLLTALSPPLIWGCLSGLEIPLYLVLVCAGVFFYLGQQSTLAALCWSTGVWLRPDGLFLAALGLVCSPDNRKWAALVTVSVILGYFAFNFAVGGQPFPTSVGAKAALGGNVLAREGTTLSQWLWLWGLSLHAGRYGPHAVLLLSAMMVGAVLTWRRRPILAAYPIAFPLVFGFFGPNGGQHGRYLVSVIPFGIVLGCVGLSAVTRRIPPVIRARGNLVALGVAAVLLAWQLGTAGLVGIAYGWNVQNINQMHRFLAEEVARRIPPGEAIAVNDVGAMGYFGSHPIVDLAGLMSPRRSLPENLAIYRPPYVIIFPDWFRQYLVTDRKTGLPIVREPGSGAVYSPVLGVKLRHNTIASREMMIVFKRFTVDTPTVSNPELIEH